MHVAVMGAGSLGTLVGGLLATDHRVTMVGREEHMRAVAANGLRISGQIERTVHPAVTTSWSAVGEPDLCLFTVKSYDTRNAAEALQSRPPPTVITLQNGLGNVQQIDEALGGRVEVLAGTATYGALLEEPGHVRCTGTGSVVIGHPAGGRSSTAEQVAQAWSSSLLECVASSAMPQRRWEKLAVNAAINPVTALTGVRNGRVLDDPLRPIAFAAAREVARVAQSQGIELDVDATVDVMSSVARATSENESSMARDVRLGSRTEIDAVTGAVIERADPAQVPVNRVLYGLIAGYELGEGIRS